MGGQKGVALFYQYLSSHHSICMAASGDNCTPASNILIYPVLYANKKMPLNIIRIEKLVQIIREQKIDCIIAEHSYTAWLALLIKKRTGVPFIIHSHNIESDRFKFMKQWWWKCYRHYEKWVHQRADYAFFISRADAEKAIKEFNINPEKQTVITYGITPPVLIKDAYLKLLNELNIYGQPFIFYFNGTMDYHPNYKAVETIISKVQPLLQQHFKNYKIVITGNRMPATLLQKINACHNCMYSGYVKDVNLFYQGSHLFLNPIVNNSGIKTKAIEALANHATVVSTISGANGIPAEICSDKLVLVKDNDWNGFVEKMVSEVNNLHKTETPAAFYDYFSWQHIAEKAALHIDELTLNNG